MLRERNEDLANLYLLSDSANEIILTLKQIVWFLGFDKKERREKLRLKGRKNQILSMKYNSKIESRRKKNCWKRPESKLQIFGNQGNRCKGSHC